MPTYVYACPKCGHEYEKLQRITDKTRAKCPECRTRGERLISGGVGLVFKGSGFYITDYKRAGEKRGTDEKKDAKKSSDASDAAKSDTSRKGDESSSGTSGGKAKGAES